MIPIAVGYQDRTPRIPTTKSDAVTDIDGAQGSRTAWPALPRCGRYDVLQDWRQAALSMNLVKLLCRAVRNLLAIICCYEPIGAKP